MIEHKVDNPEALLRFITDDDPAVRRELGNVDLKQIWEAYNRLSTEIKNKIIARIKDVGQNQLFLLICAMIDAEYPAQSAWQLAKRRRYESLHLIYDKLDEVGKNKIDEIIEECASSDDWRQRYSAGFLIVHLNKLSKYFDEFVRILEKVYDVQDHRYVLDSRDVELFEDLVEKAAAQIENGATTVEQDIFDQIKNYAKNSPNSFLKKSMDCLLAASQNAEKSILSKIQIATVMTVVC